MSEGISPSLSGVPETLPITLYLRAMESQRHDALMKDERAVALVEQLSYDFARIKQNNIDEEDHVTVILRNREFGRYAQGFLARYPGTAVVHTGAAFPPAGHESGHALGRELGPADLLPPTPSSP